MPLDARSRWVRRQMLVTGAAWFTSASRPVHAIESAHAIKLVVPFSSGGVVDMAARAFAEHFRVELQRPVVVENRAGASGTIGTLAVQRAPADGNTLLIATPSSQVIAPLLMQPRPYDGVADFAPVGRLFGFQGVLMISAALPVGSYREFVAYAKQRPGQLNFGSAGIGSTNHLLGELLKIRAGLDLVHVAFKSSPQAGQSLAAGDVHMMFDTLSNAQFWLKQGTVKVIASGAARRLEAMPDVPSLVELGVFDRSTDFWVGLMAPPGTPPEVVRRTHSVAATAMASPDIARFAARLGGESSSSNPEQFATLLDAEQARWGDVIRRNGIRAQ